MWEGAETEEICPKKQVLDLLLLFSVSPLKAKINSQGSVILSGTTNSNCAVTYVSKHPTY